MWPNYCGNYCNCNCKINTHTDRNGGGGGGGDNGADKFVTWTDDDDDDFVRLVWLLNSVCVCMLARIISQLMNGPPKGSLKAKKGGGEQMRSVLNRERKKEGKKM